MRSGIYPFKSRRMIFGWTPAALFAIWRSPTMRGRGEIGRRAGLKKGFVYQSTKNHGEFKASYFQGLGKEGKFAADIRFSL
ncbi:hypothetical protein ATN00_11660 [Sphingobium baderi]|uniref:Uncharacterized protein n=1 Tax=Sphingobium baderi TaxID=1332080 RepID=A0A0S3EZK5_9SPHN|nr:hypothetical protein ATN00_11660 [Sphingobium baderi]